jgi:hypothetical protein
MFVIVYLHIQHAFASHQKIALTFLLNLCCLQAHLKPIVSQLVVEQPKSLGLVPDAASVEGVDEILALLLGGNSYSRSFPSLVLCKH